MNWEIGQHIPKLKHRENKWKIKEDEGQMEHAQKVYYLYNYSPRM